MASELTNNEKTRDRGTFAVTKESPASATMPEIPSGVVRVDYVSAVDGRSDWALLDSPTRGDVWIVFLHGWGSNGDQLYMRADIREKWLSRFRAAGLGILSANLRDNAHMCPEAVEDLHDLLAWVRKTRNAGPFIFFSGSMGGTGNLIYATFHPEDCAAVAALGAVTDLTTHRANMKQETGIRQEIGASYVKAYGGTPEEKPDLYRRHSPLYNTEKFTMPLYLAHGEKDDLIAVEQMRALAAALAAKPNVTYVEIPGGDHDSPCFHPPAMEWILKQAETLR